MNDYYCMMFRWTLITARAAWRTCLQPRPNWKRTGDQYMYLHISDVVKNVHIIIFLCVNLEKKKTCHISSLPSLLQMCQLFWLPVLHAHPFYPGHQHSSPPARWSHQNYHEEGLLPCLWVLPLDFQRRGHGRQIRWWVSHWNDTLDLRAVFS